MKQTFTVRAIIKQDNKVLLLRRANGNPAYRGLFELPGGKVDFGEDPRTAIQREVTEETGRSIETLQLHNVYSVLDVADARHHYICLVFLASLKPDTTFTLSSEHDKYAWKKLSEVQLNAVTLETRSALNLEGEPPTTGTAEVQTTKTVAKNTAEIGDLLIYTDGGSRGNPGPSAAGFVIMSTNEHILYEGGNYLGITTNNQAEYQAVKFALEKALELGGRRLLVRMDSQLVVNQLHGVYKIRNRDLWPIHAHIKELVKRFEKVTFTHVRREFNKEADGMVNKILDERSQA